MVKKVFIDADVFVALNDINDVNHLKALNISKALVKFRLPILTSDPAFGEAITVISQNLGHREAVEFGKEILNSEIVIIEVDERLRKKAFEIFEKQRSKNIRFTDCINMAILEREGLKEIFSFDLHYKKNGFLRIGVDI